MDSVKGLTSGGALTSAREPEELKRGAHVLPPTQTIVDGTAQLQPLTVEQERHHVEKLHGEQASVCGREAHRGSRRKRRPFVTITRMPRDNVSFSALFVFLEHGTNCRIRFCSPERKKILPCMSRTVLNAEGGT